MVSGLICPVCGKENRRMRFIQVDDRHISLRVEHKDGNCKAGVFELE